MKTMKTELFERRKLGNNIVEKRHYVVNDVPQQKRREKL